MNRKFQARNDTSAVPSATPSPYSAAAPTTAARNSMPSASGSTRPRSSSPSPTAASTSPAETAHVTLRGCQPGGGPSRWRCGAGRAPVGTTWTA